MKTRRLQVLLVAAMTLGATGSAWALDAWRDRRGLFFGVGVGAGSGKSDFKGADSHIGYHLRARVGGGVSKELTLDAEFGWHAASFEEGTSDVSNSILTGLVAANYFVYEGLYLRGMGGVAQLNTDFDPGDSSGDTGLGVGLGLGYEFFASANLAVGVGGDYRLLHFDDFDFTLINFGITATWY